MAAIKRSDWEFKNYLRPKDSQSLKRQLQDMVSTAKFSMHFGPKIQTRSMISSLKSAATSMAAEASSTMEVQLRRTTHTTVTTTTVEEAHASIMIGNRLETISPNRPSQVAVPQLECHGAEYDVNHAVQQVLTTPDDAIVFELVVQELKVRQRIRWKKYVASEFNRIRGLAGDNKIAFKTLKRRWKYLGRPGERNTRNNILAESNVNDGEINQDDTSMFDESGLENDDQFHNNDGDDGNGHDEQNDNGISNTSTNFNVGDIGVNLFRPPFISKSSMPSLDVIDAIVVHTANKGDRYSSMEMELYNFMLDTPTEKSKFCSSGRSTINWKSFARRWLYWAKVSAAQDGIEIKAWNHSQLEQKLKDIKKKNRSS